ncbi:MAG TPA: hypothetical protein VFW19_00580 [Allosphingosinicella sp.]|nr:hypothetical protein [Allosphingosinicella sp.]
MRSKIAMPALTGLLLLGGCGSHSGEGGGSHMPRHGRYAGIGVFDTGPLWSKMAVPKQDAAQRTATTADDEHVIVVVDTDSGEVRECGDLSGYCTSLNPWTSVIAPAQKTPVPLTAHAADLAQSTAENSMEAEPARH